MNARPVNASWLIWQLADSAFPAGAFAHSGGLEAAWRLGALSGRRELGAFLESALHQAAGATLPFVVVSHQCPERRAEFDDLCDAWLSNHVAHRASRLQGRAFWTAVARSFRPDLGPAPEPGHLAPVYGALLRGLDAPLETALPLFLFVQLRGWVSAALRLGIVGPLEAQSLQHGLAPLGDRLAARALGARLEDLAQTSPVLDLGQGNHDRLQTRLFQS